MVQILPTLDTTFLVKLNSCNINVAVLWIYFVAVLWIYFENLLVIKLVQSYIVIYRDMLDKNEIMVYSGHQVHRKKSLS